MRILFVGESGEIRKIVGSQLESRGGTIVDQSFADFSLNLPDDDVHLIIFAAERSANARSINQLFADHRGDFSTHVIVFARDPKGGDVLNWLRSGAAAVELWPCQLARIGFLIDYLSIGTRVKSEVAALPTSTSADKSDQMIVSSSRMRSVFDKIGRVACLDSNVLFTGESGVGKSRLARLLHDTSARCQAQFTAVNCGALPENLLESELFGHKKGAFTGAESDRKGRFEEVGEGTLFLDEIDSIPLSSQCKLLRAVDNRLFEPLGSNKSIKFRGRLLAASNSQLEQLIEQGKFRADLFYRLGVVELSIPPLRDRHEDIQPIADATLKQFATRNRISANAFSAEVIALLESYSWPGNVRQLKNVVESGASMCRGDVIKLVDLSGRWVADAQEAQKHSAATVATVPDPAPRKNIPSSGQSTRTAGVSLAEEKARMEADHIRRALHAVGNNRTRAASQLGISRTMLYKKIAKYGLANGG